MDEFDDFESTTEGCDGVVCPSCGVIPSIVGATLGCNDPEGCALYNDVEEFDDEDEDEDDSDDEEEFEDEDEEDDMLEELDFEN